MQFYQNNSSKDGYPIQMSSDTDYIIDMVVDWSKQGFDLKLKEDQGYRQPYLQFTAVNTPGAVEAQMAVASVKFSKSYLEGHGPVSFNGLPSEGTFRLWIWFDFPNKQFILGVNEPVNQNSSSATKIPFQKYTGNSLSNIKFESISLLSPPYTPVPPDPEAYVPPDEKIPRQSQATLFEELYIGSYTQLNCLGRTVDAPDKQGCVSVIGSQQSGKGFCSKYKTHPWCACVNAPENPEYSAEIALVNPVVPYSCWVEPCVNNSAFNSVGTDFCPKDITICEQVFNISGKNNEVIKTPIYQNCVKKYGPPPGPGPSPGPNPPGPSSDSYIYIIIIGAIFFIIIIAILFMMLRKK